MKHKPKSFYKRVLMMILLLLIGLFTMIFVSFNLYIYSFIKKDALNQINLVSKIYQEQIATQERKKEKKFIDLSKQPKNRTGTKASIFMLNSQYKIEHFHKDAVANNAQKMKQIAAYLKTNHINLNKVSHMNVKTGDHQYYISAVKDKKQPNLYTIFFVDVTTISDFTATINLVLMIIMLVAALLSILIAAMIANSVNKPVKQLIHFARQLGKGNFSELHVKFTDKEFNELADVMNHSARQLKKADQEQKIFFQNASHELRTPLMSIKVNAEGIRYGIMDPEKSGQIILDEIDHLSKLVDDLLYQSRMDSLTSEFEKNSSDLRETISGCVERLQSIANQKGIQFEYHFDDAPVIFEYNSKMMERAINNLLTNALHYAQSRITLSCKKIHNVIQIIIANDGDDIPTKDLPHIFDRFYKGENGNHGIGLSIVKSVVELHEGKIIAANHNGPKFIIEFNKK